MVANEVEMDGKTLGATGRTHLVGVMADPVAQARAIDVGNALLQACYVREEIDTPAGGLGKDGRRHAPQKIECRASISAQNLPQARFGELAADHTGQPHRERVAQRHHLRVGVGKRQPRIGTVGRRQAHHRPKGRGEGKASVRRQYGLGIAGRSRCEDHLHRLARVDRAKRFVGVAGGKNRIHQPEAGAVDSGRKRALDHPNPLQ